MESKKKTVKKRVKSAKKVNVGLTEPQFLSELRQASAQLDAELENQVRETAYYKWEAAGRPQGRDAEFWAAAEIEVYQG